MSRPSTMATGQEWDVDRYQTQHSFVWKYGASLIDLAKPVVGERILDLGCGSGELTQQLWELSSSSDGDAADGTCTDDKAKAQRRPGSNIVFGMDADPAMVAKAQEQFPHVHFFQGDIRSFAIPEQGDDMDPKVDLIFSNAALHWVPQADMDQAVQCMARALKPGTGRLVVEFGGKGNVASIVDACHQVLQSLIDRVQSTNDGPSFTATKQLPMPWYYPSIPEFTSLLEKHGIEVLQAELYDRPTVLDGEDGMSNWIRMFGRAFLDAATELAAMSSEKGSLTTTEEDFIRAVVDILRPRWYNGTVWTADYRRIRIVGRRTM